MNRDHVPEEMLQATKRLYPVRLSSLLFGFTAGLILVFALALGFVGQRSSAEADRQAYAHDIALFDNTLDNRFALLARDQHALAAWEGYLRGRSGDAGGLIGALWYQFGHDRAILVGGDGKVAAYAREGSLDPDPGTLALDPDMRLLVARALKHFAEARAEAGGDVQAVSGTVFEAAFQDVEDQPALLSAMPVLEPGATDAARPSVLISAKFIDGDLLEYLDTQLSFNALHFNVNPPEGLPPTHKLITTLSGKPIGAFIWKSRYPGAAIWSVIFPLIVGVALILALAALVAVRKLGAMTNVVETSERRTRHMSRHDALTGLANRLRFGEELKAAVEGLDRAPFAVIAADLDRFKAVNDTYGHAAGDVVIRTVAQRLAEAVGEAGLVSRTGGDEFIMLIRAFTDRPRLEDLAARIIAAVPEPIAVETGDGGTVDTDVGVSLGIAQAPDCGATGADVMRAADEALYEAKEAGRGIAVFAEDSRHGHSWREAKGRDAEGPGVTPSARLKRAN
jgi:diguanylate cyclase (GGDEF)-like protein